MLLCVDFSVLLVLQKMQSVKLSHAYGTIYIESCDKLKDGTACRLCKLDRLLEPERLQDHILTSHFKNAVFL